MGGFIRVRQVLGPYGEDQGMDMVYFLHQIASLHPLPPQYAGQPGRGRTEIQFVGDHSIWPSIAVWNTIDDIISQVAKA